MQKCYLSVRDHNRPALMSSTEVESFGLCSCLCGLIQLNQLLQIGGLDYVLVVDIRHKDPFLPAYSQAQHSFIHGAVVQDDSVIGRQGKAKQRII